jgi:Gpi18-like mannosyltransferase
MRISEGIKLMLQRTEDLLDRSGNVVLFVILLILGTIAKVYMFRIGNFDLDGYLVPWYDYIVSHGHFAALKDEFADYNVPYLYLLTLTTFLPVAKYSAIKLISLVFDFLGAFAAYKIVGLKYQSKTLRMATFLAVFLAPTVLVNGAYWGQSDIIYTTFILWSVYFAFKKKGNLSAISFGLAFSFKMQALFLLPLIGIFLIKKLMKIRHLIYIPVTYYMLLLPSFAAGRDLIDLLSIYLKQIARSGDYLMLSLSSANLYQLFDPGNYFEIAKAGQLIALIACISIIFYAFKMRKSLDKALILKLGLFNILIVTYFLPNMHERYFFVADILSIVLAFYIPRLFYMPIVIGFSSLLSYLPFLKGEERGNIVDIRVLAAAVGIIIILLARELVKDVYINRTAKGLVDTPEKC